MRSLVIGASAGLGRAIATQLASQGHRLALVASTAADLERTAQDIRLQTGAEVHALVIDLAALNADDLKARVLSLLGGLDNLCLIAGFSDLEHDRGALPDLIATRLMAVNFTAHLRIANAFLPELEAGKGSIVTAGSVAAARGRRANMVYGAAKRGLEAYADSLRHYLAGKNSACTVQTYRLGYLKTRMTFGQKLPFPAMEPEAAAKIIVGNMGRDLGMVYLPGWWRLIMTVICLLPWPIFRRLNI
ncbi:MAG: SDR family NAD(P)-dependent oxidoreductase [Alphaproteobacteria bacterium]|nr:SDR family NAD(P)-dependent oxidoreductase [Alphaproteobacteria bacterium]